MPLSSQISDNYTVSCIIIDLSHKKVSIKSDLIELTIIAI